MAKEVKTKTKTAEDRSTEDFRLAIKAMLDERAANDPLFAEAYAKPNKSVAECCNYILGEVCNMRVTALTDAEVLGIAVHYYDEEQVNVRTSPRAHIVSPALPAIEEARKAELMREAEEAFKREQQKKFEEALQAKRKAKPAATATTTTTTQSLF